MNLPHEWVPDASLNCSNQGDHLGLSKPNIIPPYFSRIHKIFCVYLLSVFPETFGKLPPELNPVIISPTNTEVKRIPRMQT